MKKYLISLLIPASLITAQNREITFEHGDLASVLSKAKSENKMIFVDAYTSWCGPCKWMAKNVFTNDTVADYFNKNFVNYKLDMENGEGIEFAKKYEVSCYPNLLIIDANGELVHRGAGGMPAQPFIAFAGSAFSPEKTFRFHKNEFQKNNSDPEKVLAYAGLLGSSCLDPVPVVENHFKTLKAEDFLKRPNWQLILNYSNDMNSGAIKYFLANRESFEKKFGKDTVNMKLESLSKTYFNNFYTQKTFDKTAFEKSKKEFLAMKWPNAERTVYMAELNLAGKYDRPGYYAMASKDYLKYNNDAANLLNNMAWTLYVNVSDKDQLKSALKMSQRACELAPEGANLDTQAALLFKLGYYKEAESVALKAIETEKKEGNDTKDTEELLKKIKAKLQP